MLQSKKLNLIRRFICLPAKLNERGFFTIVGLCLLLVAAIFIKGVNEFEANYEHGITNFQIEHELQNAADSCLVEALEKVRNGADDIDKTDTIIPKKFQEIIGEITVEVKHKETNIRTQNGDYTDFSDLPKDTEGTVILSVASCQSPFVEEKIYRRALGYIVLDNPETENDESATVYFINDK